MQLFSKPLLIILFFSLPLSSLLAEPKITASPRLAMGFYYPSLNNISTRTDIQISLNYWMKELTNKINLVNSYSILFDDINEMSQAFRNGELDMVVAPPLILALNFDRQLLSDGFVGVLQKNKADNLVIIANHKLGKPPIKYLGKRLLLPAHDLLAEILLDTEIMKRYKRSFRQVFSQINYKNKNQRIILDIFFNRADVAVVYESVLDVMIEMNPQVSKTLTVLKRFPIKSRNYSFFHHDYLLQNKLKKLADQFSNEPKGKQILTVFKMSRIMPSKVNDLASFDILYKAYVNQKKSLRNTR